MSVKREKKKKKKNPGDHEASRSPENGFPALKLAILENTSK